MTDLQIQLDYPLHWPIGRPRTVDRDRKPALWKHDGRSLNLTEGRRRIRTALSAITRSGHRWRTTGVVLSLNIRFTQNGTRDQNISRRDPDDPGVALYFSLDGQPLVLACDRWNTVQDNMAAIAAHIEALRGQERWGVADLAQAFAGHVALPAPAGSHPPESWWQVLDVPRNASPGEIDRAWREAMATAHPDRGGSNEAAARLNQAREEGKRTNG